MHCASVAIEPVEKNSQVANHNICQPGFGYDRE